MTQRFLWVAFILSFTSTAMLTGCNALSYFGFGSGAGGILSAGVQVVIPLLAQLVSLITSATTAS